MKSDKGQTYVMIGISLLIVGIAIIFISFTSPRVYVADDTSSTTIATDDTTLYTYQYDGVIEETTVVSVTYPLNLNTATMGELMTIDGIGEAKAYAIVSYRKDVGPFTSVNDLMNIQGFGEATVEKLAPYLTV